MSMNKDTSPLGFKNNLKRGVANVFDLVFLSEVGISCFSLTVSGRLISIELQVLMGKQGPVKVG